MINEYYRIKDNCRKGLIKYLEGIIAKIPNEGTKNILDIGCGTGVPALCMADYFSGSLTAIDIDKSALAFFQDKINARNYENRIKILNISFFDLKAEHNSFDIILAEGFLNVVGFETGFEKIIELLKPGGCFIIHDEIKDQGKKNKIIENCKCKMIDSLYLDESVWWNDYYKTLDTAIKEIKDEVLLIQFQGEMKEIEQYKTDPSLFASVYHTVVKL